VANNRENSKTLSTKLRFYLFLTAPRKQLHLSIAKFAHSPELTLVTDLQK